MPSTMKAYRALALGKADVVDVEIPGLPTEDWILIKTVAVALNPTDWKHIHMLCTEFPVTVGCDFAGVVERVGANMTQKFKKGDRVLSFTHGANKNRPDVAAFAEYVPVKGPTAVRIPDNMSFEEASSLGVAIVTVGQGMYQEMPLPWPNQPLKEKKPILIWGGSSGMGAVGIQFAKMSGFEVIAAAGKHNFDYVKSLGADVVFDSRSPTAGAEIRKYTNNRLYYAWDCIGEHGSTEACFEALSSSSPEGQKLYYGDILFLPEKFPRDDVIVSSSLAYSALGEEFSLGPYHFEAKPGDYEWIKTWLPVVHDLLQAGKIKPPRLDIRDGGLKGITEGLDDMRTGKVSGSKVVYRIAEP